MMKKLIFVKHLFLFWENICFFIDRILCFLIQNYLKRFKYYDTLAYNISFPY